MNASMEGHGSESLENHPGFSKYMELVGWIYRNPEDKAADEPKDKTQKNPFDGVLNPEPRRMRPYLGDDGPESKIGLPTSKTGEYAQESGEGRTGSAKTEWQELQEALDENTISALMEIGDIAHLALYPRAANQNPDAINFQDEAGKQEYGDSENLEQMKQLLEEVMKLDELLGDGRDSNGDSNPVIDQVKSLLATARENNQVLSMLIVLATAKATASAHKDNPRNQGNYKKNDSDHKQAREKFEKTVFTRTLRSLLGDKVLSSRSSTNQETGSGDSLFANGDRVLLPVLDMYVNDKTKDELLGLLTE